MLLSIFLFLLAIPRFLSAEISVGGSGEMRIDVMLDTVSVADSELFQPNRLSPQLFVWSDLFEVSCIAAIVFDGLVENPLLPSRRGSDFCRLEMGHLPDETEGVTSLGIRYSALPRPRQDSLPPPWNSSHLLLRAGDFLECPFSIPLHPQGSGRRFLRAVYSCYGDDRVIGNLPVVRGRAFSEEHELEVVDGKVCIKGEQPPAPTDGSHDLLSTEVEGRPAITEPSSRPPSPGFPSSDLLKTRIDK